MAQIDLSKFSPSIPEMGRERQYFSGEGEASAYKALANLGGTVAGLAIDLHNKELDIRTDRESDDALNKYKESVGLETNRAMLDRDPNTGLVRSSGKTFDQHMANYMKEQKKTSYESLTNNISKVKFDPIANNWTADQNISNVFKNTELQKKDSDIVLSKSTSVNSDKIRLSNTLAIVPNLNESLKDLDTKLSTYEKINGVHASSLAKDINTKELLDTSMRATIREAAYDPSATVPFAQLSGVVTMFKSGKEYSTYVMQNLPSLSDDILSSAEESKLQSVLENDFDTYLSVDPHPQSNLWTPEEKDKNLKEFLSNRIKSSKADQGALKSRLNNWVATPQLQNFDSKTKNIPHFEEFSNIMAQIDLEPPEKMEYISKAINSYAEGIIRRNKISGEKNALTASASQRQKLVSQYGETLLKYSGLSPSEVSQAKKLYPSTVGASADLASFEKSWKGAEEKFNKEISTPGGVWASINKDSVYRERISSAFKVDNVGVLVDPKALASAWDRALVHFKAYGSVASQFAADSMFSDPVMGATMAKLEISSPEYKRKFMENVNKVSPLLAASFTNQLAKKGEGLSDLNLYRSMKFDNPEATKKVQDNITFINQTFGKKEIADWVKERTHQGFLFGEVKAEAIIADIDGVIGDSEYIKNMKEVALATGFPESEIKVMMDANAIKKGTLMEMENNPDASRWTRHSVKTKNALDKTVKSIYNDLTPINSKNLKVVARVSNESDLELINTKSNNLVKMIDSGLKNGTLKYDTQSISKVDLNKLTPKQRDWYERDTKNGSKFNQNNISFVGKSMDGSIGEMTLMYKEPSSGKYKMLKLLDSKGNSFTPSLRSVDDLKNNGEDILFNKFIKR